MARPRTCVVPPHFQQARIKRASGIASPGVSVVIFALMSSVLLCTAQRGDCALHLAARMGHVACVRLLLDAGADIEVRNKKVRFSQHAISRRFTHA